MLRDNVVDVFFGVLQSSLFFSVYLAILPLGSTIATSVSYFGVNAGNSITVRLRCLYSLLIN